MWKQLWLILGDRSGPFFTFLFFLKKLILIFSEKNTEDKLAEMMKRNEKQVCNCRNEKVSYDLVTSSDLSSNLF